MTNSKTGIILCAHGSKSADAVEHFSAFANQFQVQYSQFLVVAAYMELSSPTFSEAVDLLFEQGIRKIVAVPVFLFPGVHVLTDVPQQFAQIAQKLPAVELRLAAPIGECAELDTLLVNAISKIKIENGITNYKLLIATVGTSHDNQNEATVTMANRVGEMLGAKNTMIAYVSPVSKPSVADVLPQLAASAQKNEPLIVLPLLLFPGFYLSKLQANISQLENSDHIYCASVVGAQDGFCDLIYARAMAALQSNDSIIRSKTCNLDGSELMGLDCCGEL